MANRLEYPIFRAFDTSNNPLARGKLFTYAAGTNNPKIAYQDADGVAQHTNPITLDGSGQERIYLQGAYKLTLTDSDGSELWTEDNILGVGANNYSFASISDYGNDLADMVTALTGSSAIVLIDSVIAPTSSVTIPASIVLQFGPGARIDPDPGVIVTLGATPMAGDYQIFGGDGLVVLPAGDNRAKWFGAVGDYSQATGVGTDDTTALQRWLTACVDGCRAVLPAGTYKVTDSLSLSSVDNFEFIMQGQIAPASTVWDTSDPVAVLEVDNCTRFNMQLNFRQNVQSRWVNGNVALLTNCEDGNIYPLEIWTPAYWVNFSGQAAIKIGNASKRINVIGGDIRHAMAVFVGGGILHPTWLGVEDVTVWGTRYTGNKVDGVDGGIGFSVDSPHNKSTRVAFLGCRADGAGNVSGSLGFAASGCDFVRMAYNVARRCYEGFHVEDGCNHWDVSHNQAYDIYLAGATAQPGAAITASPTPDYGTFAYNSFESGESTFVSGISVSGDASNIITGLISKGNKVNRTGSGTGFAAWLYAFVQEGCFSNAIDWGDWEYGTYVTPAGNGGVSWGPDDHYGTYTTAADYNVDTGGALFTSHRLGITSVLGDVPASQTVTTGIIRLGDPLVDETTNNHTGGGGWETLKTLTLPAGFLRRGRGVRIEWRGKVFGAPANANQVRIQAYDGTTAVELYTAAATTIAADHSFVFRSDWMYQDAANHPRLLLDGVWDGDPVVDSLVEATTLDESAAIEIRFQATTTAVNGVLLYGSVAEAI